MANLLSEHLLSHNDLDNKMRVRNLGYSDPILKELICLWFMFMNHAVKYLIQAELLRFPMTENELRAF